VISGSLSIVNLALTVSDLIVDSPLDSLKVLCNSLGLWLTLRQLELNCCSYCPHDVKL